MRRENSPLLCGLLSCQAGLCAIDSHSVVLSDAKRRRGGGWWGRVGWRGVGGGGWLGVRNRLGEPITTQRWRKNTTVRGGGGVGWGRVGGGCSRGGCPGSALRQAAHALPTAGPYPTYRCFLSNLLILKSPRVRGTVNVPAGKCWKSIFSFRAGKEI